MKKELTNTDIFVLEEKVYDIENVLSMVKIIENALICEGSLYRSIRYKKRFEYD